MRSFFIGALMEVVALLALISSTLPDLAVVCVDFFAGQLAIYSERGLQQNSEFRCSEKHPQIRSRLDRLCGSSALGRATTRLPGLLPKPVIRRSGLGRLCRSF
jgi:hypothetical protein